MRLLRHLFRLVVELFAFAWQEKVWWMVPMVLGLLGLAALVISTQAAAPLLYALF